MPYHFVAVEATTMDCASIILPMTPPDGAAAIRTGLSPSCCALIFCKPPNRTLEDVSDPVSATPSHPIIAPKNGWEYASLRKRQPKVASVPEYLVTKPNANMQAIVSSE